MSAETVGRVVPGTIMVSIGGVASYFHCIGMDGTNTAVALTGLVGGGCGHEDEHSAADARRLAACWNVCDGMTTQDIEEMDQLEDNDQLSVWLNEKSTGLEVALAERDKLRADLYAAVDLLNEAYPHISPKAINSRLARTGPIEESYINTRVRKFLEKIDGMPAPDGGAA